MFKKNAKCIEYDKTLICVENFHIYLISLFDDIYLEFEI